MWNLFLKKKKTRGISKILKTIFSFFFSTNIKENIVKIIKKIYITPPLKTSMQERNFVFLRLLQLRLTRRTCNF